MNVCDHMLLYYMPVNYVVLYTALCFVTKPFSSFLSRYPSSTTNLTLDRQLQKLIIPHEMSQVVGFSRLDYIERLRYLGSVMLTVHPILRTVRYGHISPSFYFIDSTKLQGLTFHTIREHRPNIVLKIVINQQYALIH